jgi:hypothetical protein
MPVDAISIEIVYTNDRYSYASLFVVYCRLDVIVLPYFCHIYSIKSRKTATSRIAVALVRRVMNRCCKAIGYSTYSTYSTLNLPDLYPDNIVPFWFFRRSQEFLGLFDDIRGRELRLPYSVE